jgi:hypothetical protein
VDRAFHNTGHRADVTRQRIAQGAIYFIRSMRESVSRSAVGPRGAASVLEDARSEDVFVTAFTIDAGHDH